MSSDAWVLPEGRGTTSPRVSRDRVLLGRPHAMTNAWPPPISGGERPGCRSLRHASSDGNHARFTRSPRRRRTICIYSEHTDGHGKHESGVIVIMGRIVILAGKRVLVAPNPAASTEPSSGEEADCHQRRRANRKRQDRCLPIASRLFPPQLILHSILDHHSVFHTILPYFPCSSLLASFAKPFVSS